MLHENTKTQGDASGRQHPEDLQKERHHIHIRPSVFAENDLFMIRTQSVRIVTKDKRVEKIKETGKETTSDEDANHRNMDRVIIVGVENRNKQYPQLSDDGTYYTGNSKLGLFSRNIRLQLSGRTKIVLHDQGPHEENGLEPSTRDEKRFQVGGSNIRNINRALVGEAHKRIHRVALERPAR